MADGNIRSTLESAQEIKLTSTGRKSGKNFSIPIWFAIQGDKLYLLPVNGSSSEWYKNIVKNPKIDIQISGKKASLEAHSIKDKKGVEKVMQLFRAKYGEDDVRRYYPNQDVALESSV